VLYIKDVHNEVSH